MGGDVTVRAAHTNRLSLRSARAGTYCGIAALLVFLGVSSLGSTARGETRTISFHHIHTGEDLTVTYKVNGRYDDEALNKINHLLRDWREFGRGQDGPAADRSAVGGSPRGRLQAGDLDRLRLPLARDQFHAAPAFPASSLNSANTRWARRSTFIPGVPLEELRVGLRAQRGGVGFYPTSGAPFVHLDTGSVRHWPRMPEEQLMAVLSKGQLKSYDGTAVAQATRMPSFLARLFGGGKDEDEDTAAAAAKPTVARAPAKPTTTATAETRVEKVAAVPLPQAKPAWPKAADRYEVASAGSEPVAAPGASGSRPRTPSQCAWRRARRRSRRRTANNIINERGYWRGLPDAVDSPPVSGSRPAASAPRRAAAVASAQPATTASNTPWPLTDRGGNEPIPNALAYAAQPASIATASAVPLAPERCAPAGGAAGHHRGGEAQR